MTTRLASASKEEQRGQHVPGLLNGVHSDITHQVSRVVVMQACVHGLGQRTLSDQLPDLGSGRRISGTAAAGTLAQARRRLGAASPLPPPKPPQPLSSARHNAAMSNAHACRPGCAACCIAPSISSPSPAHPQGKPAGVACAHLDAQWRCTLFGQAQRPAVCSALQASEEMCGSSREHALRFLQRLELATQPGG